MIAKTLDFLRNNRYYFLFLLFITLVYGLLFSIADFSTVPFNGISDFLIVFSQWSVVVVATFGLLYLLSINKAVFAITFPLLTVSCAIISFFRYTANVTFTPMVVDASINNDFRTSMDLVSSGLIVFIMGVFFCSLIAVYYRWKVVRRFSFLPHLIVSFGIIVSVNYLIKPFIRPISERMPYIIFYSLNRYYCEREVALENRKAISNNAQCTSDSLTVVVVLGESLRPDHLGFNGYTRNTTPCLSKLNVHSLLNVYSEYTYTNRSIPHILTRADSLDPEIAFTEPSFISIFNSCGFNSTWLANQESANTYIYFMKECKNLVYANIGKNNYNFDVWLDVDLLKDYGIALQSASARNLIVMHTIGSHWWYNSHFSKQFQVFNPIVKSKVLSACTTDEMINSYDNTILCTDSFLANVIEKLKDRNAVLLYLSDHGESLGEDGNWLHASEAAALNSTASFVWMSERYSAKNSDKLLSLNRNLSKKWRTDFFFHSVLDAGSIESPYLQHKLSIFR